MLTRFLINQSQIITFLVLKSDTIADSRIELRGIVLPVPSNQINVTSIIILPFSLVHLYFFLFHIEIEGKCGWTIEGGKGYVAPPPSQIIGGGWLPPIGPLFLRLRKVNGYSFKEILPVSFLPLFSVTVNSQKKHNFLMYKKIISCKRTPIFGSYMIPIIIIKKLHR